MDQFRTALKYCADGLLRMTQDEQGYRLFCYTKTCFFGKDTWDDVTKSHRGKLYYQNVPVNKPFTKIFNVDEVPETNHDLVLERMKTEPYEVLDKANGHLFIMSLFQDKQGGQHVVFSTKGSLPNPDNDLLNDDIKIFISLYGDQMDKICNAMPNLTLMFESIVAHDKHSMYDLQVDKYGHENCFVLLGGAHAACLDHNNDIKNIDKIEHSHYNKTTLADDPWVELEWPALKTFSDFVGCPVIEKYDEMSGTLHDWKEHTNREGYVIHFLTDNARVKIKTSEYWQNRFKKDLTPEVILGTFKKGGFDKIQDKLPEEIANQCIAEISEMFWTWYFGVLIDTDEVVKFLQTREGLSSEDRKWLFTESEFSQYERNHIVNVVDDKDMQFHEKSIYRDLFYDWAVDNPKVHERLKEVVYNAL